MTTSSRAPLWRDRDFARLWAGETVSLFGSQITLLAIPLTAIALLDAGPAELGLIAAAGLAPFLVVTLFAGVWIDRHRRRPVMAVANLGRCLLLGLVPLLALLGALQIWHLVLISLLVAVCTVFFDLAYQAYLPSLIERDRLVDGNAKLQASAAAADVGGPGIAGVLIELISAPFAVALDALSFAVSALAIGTIRRPEPPQREAAKDVGVWRQIGEGLRLVVGDRYLRAMAAEATIYNLGSTVMETVLILYVVREIGFSPGVLGLILSIGAIGSLVAATVADRLQRRLRFGRAFMASYAVACLAPLLVPLAVPGALTAAPVLVASFALTGLGVAGSQIYVYSLRQAITPDHLLGRMNSGYRFFVTGMLPAGALVGGVLGEWIGLRGTLLVGAIVIVCALLPVARSPIPALRELPTAAASPA